MDIRKVPVLVVPGARSPDKDVRARVAQVRVVPHRVVQVRDVLPRQVPVRVVQWGLAVQDHRGRIRIRVLVRLQSRVILRRTIPSHAVRVVPGGRAAHARRALLEVLRHVPVARQAQGGSPSPAHLPRHRDQEIPVRARLVRRQANLVPDQEGMTGSQAEPPHMNQSLGLRSLPAAGVNRPF